MKTTIPLWGARGCPLLPESLRTAWDGDALPAWVALELGLSIGATFSALDYQTWSRCNHNELPEAVKKFLINVVAMRRASIRRVRVFARPWPRSLDPVLLPWSNR